jgi:hypothetical protein
MLPIGLALLAEDVPPLRSLGVEHLIGSKVIDRIGWPIAPIRNDVRGWQSRAAAHISLVSYVCKEDYTWRQP